jgi:hypothetical protein
LIEHWDGTAWTLVNSPDLTQGTLVGVTALSATSAWAVGGTMRGSQPAQTVIERWNGKSWALVPSPAAGFLASVTATSARNAWAVGFSPGDATGVIEHWAGSSWTCISATGTAGPCPPVESSTAVGRPRPAAAGARARMAAARTAPALPPMYPI